MPRTNLHTLEITQESELCLLEEIVNHISDEEKLFSFNKENYADCLTNKNLRLFVYFKEDNSKDYVVGIGLIKYNPKVSFVYTPTIKTINNERPSENSFVADRISECVYIGGAWIFPVFRGNGLYSEMFRHRLDVAVETSDGRSIITEPFGSRTEDGNGVINLPRDSSKAVYHVAMRCGFEHRAFSTEWDMGPTLFYDKHLD